MFPRKFFSSSRCRQANNEPLDVNRPASTDPTSERSNNVKSDVSNDPTVHDGAAGVSPVHQSSPPGSTLAIQSLTDRVSPGYSLDPLGLSILYAPQGERVVDVIFIHGLGGSSRRTWCKNRRPETFWPEQWLPNDEDLHCARIFTFGYNAQFRSSTQSSTMSITDFSKNLLYDMTFARDLEGRPLHLGDVPIIFVVHSMGGLVFKKAYLDAQLDFRYAAVMSSTKAVVFLATPHRGSDLAPYLNRLLSISFGSSSKRYVAELKESSIFLRTVNEKFRHVANELQIFSFYETLKTPVGMLSTLILEPESAKLGYPGEITRSLHANHQSVCKFETPQDPNFRVILGALKDLVSSYRSINAESDIQDMEMLHRLLSVPKAIDHDFDLFSGRRADGTCKWILEQDNVRSWLSSPSQSEVLMLHGRPARGKSIMASFLVQYLCDSGAAVQYFFFRSGDDTKQSIAALIKTLAFQIAQQVPSFRKILIEVANSGYKPRDAEWKSIWKKLFVGLLFKMEIQSPLYWIIDGVDEATSPNRLFELLSDLDSSKTPIRVLLTNRWSQGLVSALERTSSKVSSSMLCIDNDTTDMRIYVEEELTQNNWGEEMTEKVVQQVLERANNNFLWVHLLVEELKDCNTEEDIADRFLELPPGMDGLYQRMEESICHIRRPSDKNLAHQLLTWVMHARRTLSGEELTAVLEPGFGRLLDISQTASRLCGYFIAIEGDNKIGLIHQTAREYLTATSTLPFSLDFRVSHAEIFKQSIAPFLDKDLRAKLQRTPLSQLEYRATSWPYHLSAIELYEDGYDYVNLLAQFFTQPSVLIWIYILASLDQLSVLIEASRSLYAIVRRKRKANAASASVLQGFDELEVLEGWSRDLLKLLGKFGSHLTQNPASIYDSIVPFCPTTSSVHRFFGKQNTSSLTILEPPEDWDDCLARVSVGDENVATLLCCSGRYIAVVSSAKTIIIWNCETFHQENELEHGEPVSSLCFNSKGDRLATYGFRHTKIWSPQTGKLLLSFPNHPEIRSLCLQFVDDDTALIMGSDFRCVLRTSLISEGLPLWVNVNPQLLDKAKTIEGTYLNSPVALAINPDGSKIAAAYRGFPFTIWSIDSGTPLKYLSRPRKPSQTSELLPFVSKMSWHPSGEELIGILLDGCTFKLNIVDGSYEEHPPTPGQTPFDIICSPDGLVYAVCGVLGTIRLFDYQTSTLIYQLTSEGIITGFCFSYDGRKFYDIRGSHCTVWEPNALMRLTTLDDDAALSQAEDESIRQSQAASESYTEDSSPILLTSLSPQKNIVGFGNEDGLVELFDYETLERIPVGQTASQMSIEHLAWSESGDRICYAEIGGRLNIIQVEQGSNGRKARRVERFKPKAHSNDIIQLLFLPGSNALLVSSSSSAECWSLEPAKIETAWDYGPSLSSRHWLSYPKSPQHLLSITPDSVSVHKRRDLEEVLTFRWNDSKSTDANVKEEIDSVTPTFLDGHILVKISRRTSSQKLRPRFLIFDAGQVPPGTISPMVIPERVAEVVEMPLNVLNNGKLVFIDQSFWVCSWHIGSMQNVDDVQRHFFIPRDWLSLQSLGLLQITSTGAILCPRKGSISVIQSSIGSVY